MTNQSANPLYNLADQLNQSYSQAKLRRLCTFVGVGSENIEQHTKFDLALGLVKELHQKQQLNTLQNIVSAKEDKDLGRPNVEWYLLFEQAQSFSTASAKYSVPFDWRIGITVLLLLSLAVGLSVYRPSGNVNNVDVGNENGVVNVVSGDQINNINPTNTPAPPTATPTQTPTPTPTPTLFPPTQEGETLILVADFVDPEGVDSQLFTQNLIADLQTTLVDHANIRIEYLQTVITAAEGSDRAMQIAEDPAFNADIVIWGNYTQPPEPQVHIHFDIVQEQETYLDTGLYERHGGAQLLQPSMFNFQVAMGQYLGEMVAFTAGLILFEDRSFNEAVAYFETAAQAIDKELAVDFTPAIRFYRGTNFLYLGRAKEAQPDLTALEPLVATQIAAFEQGDQTAFEGNLLSSMLNNIGLVYDILGDKQEALDFFNQALPITRDVGDRSGEAYTLNNIGAVYDALGDKQEALDFYNQALPIFRDVGHRSGEATTLDNIGGVYSALGDKQQA
ncbi:MAG: tetratricopeptide repeat protein, partial [Candidatus Promineifilaceae bacterium]